MESHDALKREVAITAYNDFKKTARIVRTEGNIKLVKVMQYGDAMFEFDDLPQHQKNSYLVYAGDVIDVCARHFGK